MLAAFQQFLARVPHPHIAHIKNVVFQIHSRKMQPLSDGPQILGDEASAATLHALSRALVKRFVSLECIVFNITKAGPLMVYALQIPLEFLRKC